MHTLLEKAAARIAAGTAPLENAAEAVELARLPRSENPDIFACAALARARFAGPVFTCAIINAKSGRCAENCAFCAQSSFHHTDAPVYGLVGTDVLLKHAEEMMLPNRLQTLVSLLIRNLPQQLHPSVVYQTLR